MLPTFIALSVVLALALVFFSLRHQKERQAWLEQKSALEDRNANDLEEGETRRRRPPE